jgi:nucleotide-binding universal stress UspA family protein
MLLTMNTSQTKIIVGVDGSEHAARALDWAMAEAELRDVALRVVSAWHVPAAAYGAPGFAPTSDRSVQETFKEVAEDNAKAAVERARAGGINAAAAVLQGQPAEVLVEAAADADLLVIGSRGRGGFAGLLLGSVSAQCAHHAPCPLVIVRPPADEA